MIRSNLEVLRQQRLYLSRNLCIHVSVKTAKTHQQNLSTGHIFAAPQHTLVRNQGNGHISTPLARNGDNLPLRLIQQLRNRSGQFLQKRNLRGLLRLHVGKHTDTRHGPRQLCFCPWDSLLVLLFSFTSIHRFFSSFIPFCGMMKQPHNLFSDYPIHVALDRSRVWAAKMGTPLFKRFSLPSLSKRVIALLRV